MKELEIELLGSPALRQKAEEVVEIDDELRTIIADMFTTMYAAEGIGLAGNQIGLLKRVVVIDLKNEESEPMALVNPRITEQSRDTEKSEEGCLSIPGVSALVERATEVTVEALDQEGHPLRIEADGLLARCLQHEIDHLDGVLFIDRLSSLKRSMLLKKYRSLSNEDSGAAASAGPRRHGG